MSILTETLDSLLEAEHDALLQGDLERVAQLLEEKETLVGGLAEMPEPDESLIPLQPKIRRNNELFDHALAGVRAVVGRLDALQSMRKNLDTYDAKGQRLSIGGSPEKRLEKRA